MQERCGWKEGEKVGLLEKFLGKVYSEEIANGLAWCGRHKLLVFGLLASVVLIGGFLILPGLRRLIGPLRSMSTPLWLGLLLIAWGVLLTRRVYIPRRPELEPEFVEDFGRGLERWEYYGGWTTAKEDGDHILIVTESGDGGIARPCLLWTDYVFEFETKIVKNNTTWLIRARDVFNYVMLQCGQTGLNPHLRTGAVWHLEPPVAFPKGFALSLNTWFGVRVAVQGTWVRVSVEVDGVWTEIYNDDLLKPRFARHRMGGKDNGQILVLQLSYPVGSVGFREWGETEVAHFRKVRVTRM